MLPPQRSLPSSQSVELVSYLEGTDNARCLAIASFTFILYDYFTTLHAEIEYFWSGRWSLSRILFLINRYLPPIILIIILICFLATDLSKEFCDSAIRASFTLTTMAMIIIQAILVLRIWYLFKHSKTAQLLVTATFFIAVLVQSSILSIPFRYLQSETITEPGASILRLGCRAPPAKDIWLIFVSPVVVHTILYLLTAYRAVISDRIAAEAPPLMSRLLRDGGILYLIIFISVNFSAIGAALTNYPLINLPAIYSNFMLAINSVCVSRVMLGMRSLAAELISDSTLASNSIELSTVPWRRSPRSIKATTVDRTAHVIDIRGGIDPEESDGSARNYYTISGQMSLDREMNMTAGYYR